MSAVGGCCPSSAAITARATCCPIQKPLPASPSSQPRPPTTWSSRPPTTRAATLPVPAISAYPSSWWVPDPNMPSRSCCRMTCRQPRAASRSVTCSVNRAVCSPAIAMVAVVWRSAASGPAPGLDGGLADRRHRGRRSPRRWGFRRWTVRSRGHDQPMSSTSARVLVPPASTARSSWSRCSTSVLISVCIGRSCGGLAGRGGYLIVREIFSAYEYQERRILTTERAAVTREHAPAVADRIRALLPDMPSAVGAGRRLPAPRTAGAVDTVDQRSGRASRDVRRDSHPVLPDDRLLRLRGTASRPRDRFRPQRHGGSDAWTPGPPRSGADSVPTTRPRNSSAC